MRVGLLIWNITITTARTTATTTIANTYDLGIDEHFRSFGS